jgi:hypothetical protein
MAYPPLVQYATEQEYREHFERVYCSGPIACFDQITVRFRKHQFDHCFFESSNRDKVKDQFSTLRAERIDWIAAALQDPNADLYAGWDNTRKRYDHSRRVVLVVQNYVVVIRLTGPGKADFVTAYVADNQRTLTRLRQGQKWNPSCA